MRDLITLVAIPLLIFLSHFAGIFSFPILHGFKTGDYVVPILGWRFDNWFSYMVTSLIVLQPLFLIGGILTYAGHKLSIDYFHSAYPSVILNLVSLVLWTIVLMRYRVGEMPSKAGWIALILVLTAGFLAIYAGSQSLPKS